MALFPLANQHYVRSCRVMLRGCTAAGHGATCVTAATFTPPLEMCLRSEEEEEEKWERWTKSDNASSVRPCSYNGVGRSVGRSVAALSLTAIALIPPRDLFSPSPIRPSTHKLAHIYERAYNFYYFSTYFVKNYRFLQYNSYLPTLISGKTVGSCNGKVLGRQPFFI